MSHHSDTEFRLPLEVRPLADARIAVRDYYRRKGLRLEFSFDGNLVGDFGEACAVEEYGMKLVEAKSNAGFDGYTPDGKRTIQVKAKGRLPPRTRSHSATRKRTPTTCLSSNSILIAASAAPSTTARSTMCGRSCPASRGRGRSRSPFRGFDKRRHGFAMPSVSRWSARTTGSEAARLLPEPATLAATNKCLARSNKSRSGRKRQRSESAMTAPPVYWETSL